MENSRNNSIDRTLSEALEQSIRRRVRSDETLVLGFSGGLDSTVLLHALAPLARENRFCLSALHVHHGLSPNADEWERHCANCCGEWGIPFAASRVAVDRRASEGLEAAARRARHGVFAKTPGDWIVLAHHRGDQTETVLFNLLRGTGLRGAAGMTEVNGRLLRPLLGVPRDTIRRYAIEHRLNWIEDESNGDVGFSRNYLRHEILPLLAQRFPGTEKSLAAASRHFDEAEHLLDDLARGDLKAHVGGFPLPIAAIRDLSEPRARNVLRYLLSQATYRIPSAERLREATHQLLHAAPDRHPRVEFGDCVLMRRNGAIVADPVLTADQD